MLELLVFRVMRRPLPPFRLPSILVEVELVMATIRSFKFTLPFVVDASNSAFRESSTKRFTCPLVVIISKTPVSGRRASHSILALEVFK